MYDKFDVETAQLGSARETLRGMRAERKAKSARAGAASQAAYATLSSQYINNTSATQGGGVISSFLGGKRGGTELAASQGGSLPLGNTQSDVSASMLLEGGAGPPPGVYAGFDTQAALMEEESIIETSALDEDDFDQNPCMSALVRVLEHLHQKQGGAEPAEMPPWMGALHSSFTNPGTPINVKLFLAKVIVRARRVFKPYAEKWFAPLIEVGHGRETLFAFLYELMIINISLFYQISYQQISLNRLGFLKTLKEQRELTHTMSAILHTLRIEVRSTSNALVSRYSEPCGLCHQLRRVLKPAERL